jgi:hypothetical protein
MSREIKIDDQGIKSAEHGTGDLSARAHEAAALVQAA